MDNVYSKLSNLVIGWGYSENEAREILAEEAEEYGYEIYDYEC